MAPYDFELMVQGAAEADHKEWYHTRQICWSIYCANPPKNPKANIDSYWPLDKGVKAPAQTVEEYQAAKARFEKRFNKE